MLAKLIWFAAFVTGSCLAASVQLPGSHLVVPATSAGGASFTYNGTLTESDTIAFTQSGDPCLQPNDGYCTNGAGVIVVPATLAPKNIGEALTFAGPAGIIPAGTWTYGSLLMSISGVGTVQVFPTTGAAGFGNARPPLGLNLPATSLGALGFGTFSQTDPVITFIVADGNFGDNSRQFVLSQTATTDVADIWWNPNESGWGMQLVGTGAFVFATVYIYDAEGEPVWITGELEAAGSAPTTYTGPLYVTSGPYFGGPFNAAPVTTLQAGTMTFVLTDQNTGLLNYTVNGVTVDKSVQRQPLTLDDYSGSYAAIDTRIARGCLDAANNGARLTAATLQITQNGATMSAVWSFAGGEVCTHTGTYTQLGRMGTFAADYSCTSGEVGASTHSEMTNSLDILKARLDTHSTNRGCTTRGRVSGIIPDAPD